MFLSPICDHILFFHTESHYNILCHVLCFLYILCVKHWLKWSYLRKIYFLHPEKSNSFSPDNLWDILALSWMRLERPITILWWSGRRLSIIRKTLMLTRKMMMLIMLKSLMAMTSSKKQVNTHQFLNKEPKVMIILNFECS